MRTQVTLAVLAAAALSLASQRANAQNIVLDGQTLLVGVNGGGSLQERGAPGPTPTSPFIGIQYDSTGTGNYSAGYDFITPGDPFQYYAVGVNGSYVTQSYAGTRTAAAEGSNPLGMSTSNTSSGSTLETTSTGGSFGGVGVTQTMSYQKSGAGSGILVFDVTLTNTSGSALGDVAYSTGLDPDQDVYFDYNYETENVINNSNYIYATGLATAWTIGIKNTSSYASTDWINTGFWDDYGSDENPIVGTNSEYLSDGQYSGSDYGDYTINMDWDLGGLAAGASDTLTYDYVIAGTPALSISETSTPDAASTLALLGLALAGLIALRRKLVLA